ncbi:MAG: uroporphyrinogen decarboxylase family protein [Candidatus Latescibacter sp.]|nr:uroporphyrinogen decarboxylase family protein [Candidatus Latescibacter sp.]
MTGKEKIEAAFSPEGTPEIPAVICYESIFIRDHWAKLTGVPWWNQFSPDIETQLSWRREVIRCTGQDWFRLPYTLSRENRKNIDLEVRPEGVFRIDRRSGVSERLFEPPIGGEHLTGGEAIPHFTLTETTDEVDALIPLPAGSGKTIEDGSGVLAARLLDEFGGEVFPFCHVSSPLWRCYDLWGFENMMVMIASQPELVRHAAARYLELSLHCVRQAAALGARGIWIEECMTDMISPAAFASLNLPFLRRLIEEISACGMKSVYYYCGSPAGKWDLLLSAGADALSLEEGKKGFEIDVAELATNVPGRCTLLGNLDSIGVLQNGSEQELRAEIKRQIAAGRANRSRFIMSIGSPVTPATPVERVRLYCDIVHEMGNR